MLYCERMISPQHPYGTPSEEPNLWPLFLFWMAFLVATVGAVGLGVYAASTGRWLMAALFLPLAVGIIAARQMLVTRINWTR